MTLFLGGPPRAENVIFSENQTRKSFIMSHRKVNINFTKIEITPQIGGLTYI